MGKYTIIDEPVFITEIQERRSIHGGNVHTAHLKGIKTQRDYKTYIDPGNMNYRHWSHLIPLGQTKGVVLGEGLKLKDEAKGIINADAIPEITYVVTKVELADIISEYWDNQTRFGKLFRAEEKPKEFKPQISVVQQSALRALQSSYEARVDDDLWMEK